jgi:hypothetical protein
MARRSTHPRRNRLPKRPGSKRTVALIGLGVFAVADVLLIALALGVVGGGADGGDTTARPSATFTAEASAEPQEEPDPISLASPVLRTLAVVDEQVAWRAERGNCDTQAVIEVTSDSGATWTQTRPVTTEGREVLWLWAQDADYAQSIVGAADGCLPTGIRTFTAGAFWSLSPDAIGLASYIDSAGALVTPLGFAAPCESPVDVDEQEGLLTVLCADGTLHQTSDGSAWTRAAVAGALAMTGTGDSYLIAMRNAPSCGGVALVTLPVQSLGTGAAASEPLACLTGAIDLGATVVSAGGDSVWLWSGSESAVHNLSELLS